MGEEVRNLYVHFPFCRRKCTYCALFSRAGVSSSDRAEYVKHLASAVQAILPPRDTPPLSTIYFGGGSPALCNLSPLLDALSAKIDAKTEFSVELHPLDVTRENLKALKEGGVNRISMGLQSLNDEILKHMGRGYTFTEAEKSFFLIKEYFPNAGIDLIIGYPDDMWGQSPHLNRIASWGLTHCSAYSLILEENSALHRMGTRSLDDEELMDSLTAASRFIEGIGLKRYEISNYAIPGFECRHNMATWRGEDYYGLGIGAHGRIGQKRTRNWWGKSQADSPDWWGQSPEIEDVSEEFDFKERRLFALRTREGLDASERPEWIDILDKFCAEGILTQKKSRYVLTARGREVCDSIIAELI